MFQCRPKGASSTWFVIVIECSRSNCFAHRKQGIKNDIKIMENVGVSATHVRWALKSTGTRFCLCSSLKNIEKKKPTNRRRRGNTTEDRPNVAEQVFFFVCECVSALWVKSEKSQKKREKEGEKCKNQLTTRSSVFPPLIAFSFSFFSSISLPLSFSLLLFCFSVPAAFDRL